MLYRVRLGIDFPIPGVSNVKQLPSNNVIVDTGDYDVTDTETEEVVESVDTEEVVESVDTEPCCDNLVSNTVELVGGDTEEELIETVTEEVIETVTEEVSDNVK